MCIRDSFCPVQHPADDKDSEWITTHFEYHSMEENLLKLDTVSYTHLDVYKRQEKDIQDLTDKHVKKIDEMCAKKEKELMEI